MPRATCRLQLHAGFTFADAEGVVPYLAALGISHLYLSPILMARRGSLHGYDIVDHEALNPELGGMAGLERLHATLAARDMGIILDIVPNHMGVGGADNRWWLDVLEWGEDSPFARFFDIDWRPARAEMRGKLLLPFLGDHYGAVLERGELAPRFDAAAGSLSVWYWDHRHPLAPADYAEVLAPAIPLLEVEADRDELMAVIEACRRLARRLPVRERRRQAGEAKTRLAALAAERPPVAAAIARVLTVLAGRVGDPLSFAPLHALLERQAWRLTYWRVAADEINYRRFFDINGLAALRMVEEPELFARAHRLPFDLIRRGIVHGLRIDHVDGLFNPAEYCRMVRAQAPVPLWVEKILAHHEPIRRDWPVAGTTGYDFCNQVLGLFVSGDGEALMSATYTDFTGLAMDFDAAAIEAKRAVVNESMTAEVRTLALRLGRIAASHWRSRDFTLSALFRALREVMAALPVYRTYVTPRRVTETDRRYIDWAVAKARKVGGDPSATDFVHAMLLADDCGGAYARRAVVDIAMRVQQVTGPLTAKGIEDTALYRCNRLIALNEVGGDPRRFGLSPLAFHQAAAARRRSHPDALLATATHDTKRGEDTRVRIAALAERPEEWRQHVERWRQLNGPFRKLLDSGPAPDPNDEFFLYQTLFGAWPGEAADFAERMAATAVKAAREAKRRTSWAEPDEAYEAAIADFVRRILETGRRNPFLDDLKTQHQRQSAAGMIAGLAQVLLKLTCPGIPDFYQGTELWDLSLVDPDNRRPVDWERRRALLGGLTAGPLPADPRDWESGAVKQELIRRALDLRHRRPALFARGAYRPLTPRGPRSAHLLAFSRHDAEAAVVVAVPLLLGRLWQGGPPGPDFWRGAAIEAPRRVCSRWHDLLGGGIVRPAIRRGVPMLPAPELFRAFPLALLEALE
ncbi:MAG: malto-oligosyltrehalose synthase [Magnetospirillum sp.]|nr:malto-oligosyltrehalose synthase [Magnetospirillum sp.]